MLLPALLVFSTLRVVSHVQGREISVIRHLDGDLFTTEGACNEACTELSSGTGSPCSRGPPTGIPISNGTCVCQCNGALPVFREDLHICVSDIHECSVAGFVSNSGVIEKVPYVFLPQSGQIVYPQAEIRFEGVTTPVCGIAGSQQLGKSGWLELRNLSNAEPPFRIFRDEGRTFLQWIGEDGLREAAEGKVVLTKLVCRDASPNSNNPGVFTPCVAFRVAGSPSKSNIREVTFSSTIKSSQSLSVLEYTVIGISSILLALIYVASVSLYVHSRKARRRIAEEPEVVITGGRDGAGVVKSNPLLVASRHYESEANSLASDDEIHEDNANSDGEQTFENISYCSQQQVTAALIHPQCVYPDSNSLALGNGSLMGERIPEEDVRIVETIENSYQHETPVLPGTQRRKLYFNPAYFERQLLLAPPPAAIEFLLKIREVISIAKHKMTAKRFVPTLTGIPEEENSSERCSSGNKQRGNSTRSSLARSRRTQGCTGCPGCTETSGRALAGLPDLGRSMLGENRVRAWLEDVKPLEKRWKEFEPEARRSGTRFDRDFIREKASIDFYRSENSPGARTPATWKENPPMLRTFQNIARSEILGEDDRHSLSKRSTKSMFEESNYDRYYRARKKSGSCRDAEDRENAINAKVRKAIENSFIKQMEENASLGQRKSSTGDDTVDGKPRKVEERSFKVEERSFKVEERSFKVEEMKNGDLMLGDAERSKKSSRELPDMINQLPSFKIPAKRIMDAVIKEMVDAKALEHAQRWQNQSEYEIDSLERASRKCNDSESKRSQNNVSGENRSEENGGETCEEDGGALNKMATENEKMAACEKINARYDKTGVARNKVSVGLDKMAARDKMAAGYEKMVFVHDKMSAREKITNGRNGIACLQEKMSSEHNGMTEDDKMASEHDKMAAIGENEVSRRNYCNNLPEILSQRREGYSLVSEVYVNDGYASPAGSDDSGPEIRYEPENPGHLTIKVQDSPENYVKVDESEYEPDTLDRKPMRLKINGDVTYERDTTSESYVDSLERPGHILLKSKSSFRNDGDERNDDSLHRGYGSLREIYEARLRSNLRETDFMASSRSLDGEIDDSSWKKNKYLTPNMRQARRQRKPQNQPDVVPLPPQVEEIYQRPKPPRRVEYAVEAGRGRSPGLDDQKNGSDRRKDEAGDPTAGDDSPVERPPEPLVGSHVTRSTSTIDPGVTNKYEELAPTTLNNHDKVTTLKSYDKVTTLNNHDKVTTLNSYDRVVTLNNCDKVTTLNSYDKVTTLNSHDKVTTFNSCDKVTTLNSYDKVTTLNNHDKVTTLNNHDKVVNDSVASSEPVTLDKVMTLNKVMNMKNSGRRSSKNSVTLGKVVASSDKVTTFGRSLTLDKVTNGTGKGIEDSGYLSSTDSNESQKRLLRRESVSETDETESMGDGASESGAESVGTDSVFFGNFRRFAELSSFNKSVDSGLDFSTRNNLPSTCQPRYAIGEKNNALANDSETESFVTVRLPHS